MTLAPGQTYNYSGSLSPSLAGTYTFYVAYQKPDGSWVMPVDPENGTTNRLSITVQGVGPTLTKKSPDYISASPNPQTVYLYGTRLAKTVFLHMQFPNGTVTDFWYLPWEIFSRKDDQLGIKIKFTMRGTYRVRARTLDNVWSNELPIEVH